MNRRAALIAVVLVITAAVLPAGMALRPRLDAPLPSQAAADASAGNPGPADVDGGALVAGRGAGMAFRYPATWFSHPVTEVDLGGGSTELVLTSDPFPADCVDPMSDLNCLSEHPMGPGSIRIEIGAASVDGTVFDPVPPGVPAGVQIRDAIIGGMPARRTDRFDIADHPVDVSWRVAVADSVQRAALVSVTATDPGSGALRAAAERLVDSITFDVRPAPVPIDPAGRVAAARVARVAGVARVVEDGGLVVMGDRATPALDDCFTAAIDRPASMLIEVTSNVLPAGTVQVACTVTAELLADAFWNVTITARSGAGSTVPGTTMTIVEWISTAGEPAGDSWSGLVPAARAPGFLALDPTGASAVARLVTQFDWDDSDFYRCFPDAPGIGGGSIFTGPDHVVHPLGVDAVCTTEVAVRPDLDAFDVTLTAAWRADDVRPAGQLTVRLQVDRDGTIHGPTIEGDPLP